MAFSFRKIISNIGYFKKPEDDEIHESGNQNDLNVDGKSLRTQLDAGDGETLNFERLEPDSTSIQASGEYSFSSLKIPETVKNFHTKRGSFSDTDLLTVCVAKPKKGKKKIKKMKVDVEKANKSFDENLKCDDTENTPKHVLLECKSSEIFSERIKKFDFSKSFEIDSDNSSDEEDNIDIESLSDEDLSLESEDKGSIKMCRKVSTASQISSDDIDVIPSASPESFGDVEVDKNEEERIALLQNYQIKFENLECMLKKMLTQFKFHIEVSKIFNSKAFVTVPSGNNMAMSPKLLEDCTFIEKISRGVSPAGSWNIIMEKEDDITKNKIKIQLESIQNLIEAFKNTYLKNQEKTAMNQKHMLKRRNTYYMHKGTKHFKKLHVNNKKKIKHYDFPDIREAMIKLFCPDEDEIQNTDTSLNDSNKCICHCHNTSQTDSGLTTKSDDGSMSITSSIGNFSLDASTLSAFSESLDQIISYSSFQDTSLYSTLLQKPAIERLTFYVQVHSIQIRCENADQDFESKNVITFHCPACKITENEEYGLLKHILSQKHCEKIHFLYKTAYIKKCVASGKEIQPSTVLNPMTMYRDENKIVCFGDAMYACSLCFENLIVGESMLMGHCSEQQHLERRENLFEILE